MKMKATFKVPFRRRREGKTNYAKRLSTLKSGAIKLVVRISNKNIVAQLIKFNEKGDETLVSVHSRELGKFGWNLSGKNSPAAYLLGSLIAKKAKDKGINSAILDIGFRTPTKQSIQYCVLKGAVENGLDIPHSEDVLPADDRVKGALIASYMKTLQGEELTKRFSGYEKNKIAADSIEKVFEQTKAKIVGA